MARNPSTSHIRQQLRAVAERLSLQIDSLLSTKGPLVQGAFQINGATCGNPNCKCAKGKLHPTALLVVSEEGKRRNIYVPASDRYEIQRQNKRYQYWRKARAEVVKLNAELLTLADDLMTSTAKAYVPKRKRLGSSQSQSKNKKGANTSQKS